jgi:hypothetical protein
MRKAISAVLLAGALVVSCAKTEQVAKEVGGTGGTAAGAGGTSSGGTGGVAIDAGTGGDGLDTCEGAAEAHSYTGCEFWPTIVPNNVWSIFDFAVVVANAGQKAADITIERAGQQVSVGSVEPGGLRKFFLPWIPELKGGDADECGNSVALEHSVRAPEGAYRLSSSVPVTVYQFNALEYRGEGGPTGKDWQSCPGNTTCQNPQINAKVGCFSFSNDASLLLPTSALTGTYRIVGQKGWAMVGQPSYFAITGTENSTQVTVKLAANAEVIYGNDVPGMPGGLDLELSLGRGEVVQVVGAPSADMAGSLVLADKPVQVIAGMPCVNQPADMNAPACDHIEESVFPAETLGTHYFVTVPTGPNGKPVGHFVRLVGNADGTNLTYPGTPPAGAPATLNAGDVVDLGVVANDFEIVADQALAVVMFQLGGSQVDPDTAPHLRRGDPDQSAPASVEQYRKKYVFLAPDDYEVNFADVVLEQGTTLTLDGKPVDITPTPISSGWGVARLKLDAGNQGAHVLEASAPVGLQVLGYGMFTSYQYPGGLDLETITPPPVR